MRLAARGRRDMDGNVQTITDADERAALRRKGARMRWISVIIATVLTTLYVLLSSPQPTR
jgi:hypothetical protein